MSVGIALGDHRARKFDARGNSVARSLAAHAWARQLARFQCQLKLKISRELRIGETSAADRVSGNRGYFEVGGTGLRRYDAAR
jgi:hypothetical protein